jgi:hypothetical protein
LASLAAARSQDPQSEHCRALVKVTHIVRYQRIGWTIYWRLRDHLVIGIGKPGSPLEANFERLAEH